MATFGLTLFAACMLMFHNYSRRRGAGLTGDAAVHLGLWLPVIEGCDWEAGNLSEDCRVPVIAEIGPYYDDGDVMHLTPANRLGRSLSRITYRTATALLKLAYLVQVIKSLHGPDGYR